MCHFHVKLDTLLRNGYHLLYHGKSIRLITVICSHSPLRYKNLLPLAMQDSGWRLWHVFLIPMLSAHQRLNAFSDFSEFRRSLNLNWKIFWMWIVAARRLEVVVSSTSSEYICLLDDTCDTSSDSDRSEIDVECDTSTELGRYDYEQVPGRRHS